MALPEPMRPSKAPDSCLAPSDGSLQFATGRTGRHEPSLLKSLRKTAPFDLSRDWASPGTGDPGSGSWGSNPRSGAGNGAEADRRQDDQGGDGEADHQGCDGELGLRHGGTVRHRAPRPSPLEAQVAERIALGPSALAGERLPERADHDRGSRYEREPAAPPERQRDEVGAPARRREHAVEHTKERRQADE